MALCQKPFRRAGLEHGCGQCLPCRISRRRLWTARLILESYCHDENCFVTLTYDPEHLPANNTVVPRDLSLFIKRLRKELSPARIRFFAVGEYGDTTGRPHYHALLYGVGPHLQPLIESCWGRGHVHVGEVTPESASYTAGYTIKKLTKKDDYRLKEGQHPEFARMSLKPGIGAFAVEEISRVMYSNAGSVAIDRKGDVPSTIRINGKEMPLGRYLVGLLRKSYGLSHKSPEPLARASQIAGSLMNCDLDYVRSRERRRIQHGRNAAARVSLIRSKRTSI